MILRKTKLISGLSSIHQIQDLHIEQLVLDSKEIGTEREQEARIPSLLLHLHPIPIHTRLGSSFELFILNYPTKVEEKQLRAKRERTKEEALICNRSSVPLSQFRR